MLNDGNELKGLVKYNDREGILSFQDGSTSKVLTPTRVAAFEFTDESLGKRRLFYTFDYEDSETNVERPLFFEVLKEYESFVILSKADRVIVDKKTRPSSITGMNPVTGGYDAPFVAKNKNRLVVSQTETIYLMKLSGEIKPYFKIVDSEDGQKSLIFAGNDTKTKNKMIDRDLLEEFITPSQYEKLTQFAREHNLSFKKKDEFLTILGYYDELIQK